MSEVKNAPLDTGKSIRGRPTGRRKWLFRLAAMTLVPLALFTILECSLRIGGYGRTTRFFLDGTQLERPGVLIDNREYGQWAFPRSQFKPPSPVPFVLEEEKKPGTFRIFVLGESAAYGFPDPAFSFGRILEVLLRTRHPDVRFEVINAAMVAINSHIILPIAQECAEREPDLFVVDMGNNEIIGPYGAAGVVGSSAPSRSTIRTNLTIRKTRTGQLFESLISSFRGEQDSHLSKKLAGMTIFSNSHIRFDDPRLSRTYDQYRENLRDVCRAGINAGAPVIVCTIPVNLKDSAPFGSLHSPNVSQEQIALWNATYAEGIRLENEKKHAEALAQFQKASEIDDSYAELVFRQARCLLALGKPTEANEKYLRARDLDTLRFRTDSTLNRIIRETSEEQAGKGVHLADAETAFAEASPMKIPGDELFLEHVHMNFPGNYLMARTVLEKILPILDARYQARQKSEPLTQQQCAERLAFTGWNEQRTLNAVRSILFGDVPFTTQLDAEKRNRRWEAKARTLQSHLTGEGLQRAIEMTSSALKTSRDDWMIRINYVDLLKAAGDPGLAQEELKLILRNFHHCFVAHCYLGQIQLSSRQAKDAESHFRKAIEINPEWGEAHTGLAASLGAQGRVEEGLAIYETQLAKSQDRGDILVEMGIYLFKANRIDDSKHRLLEAVELKPNDARAHVTLGDIALKTGNRSEALAQYETALKIMPDWPDLQTDVAKLKNETGPPQKK